MVEPKKNLTKKQQAVVTAIEAGLSAREIIRTYHVGDQTVKNMKAFAVMPVSVPEALPDATQILEGKLISLQDQVNRYKGLYQNAQRSQNVFEELAAEAKSVITPIKPLPQAPKLSTKKQVIHEDVVLHLSDLHADEVVIPHQVGNLERFDFNIALARAEYLVDTIIKFTKTSLDNYKFDTLWILANGDFTNGEIHDAVKHSYYKNQFRNSLAIAQMFALMIRDLAPHFPQIKILCLSGNHGRRTMKKDYPSAWNNWDYLIYEMAKQHCMEINNCDWIIPDSFSANLDIRGHGFCVFHGDDIRSWNSIPWYGIERKTRRLAALNATQGQQIKYYAMGHFHNPATQDNLLGETIINGSWVATTPYVYNSMSTFNEPSQLIHGVHDHHGISWRLKVRLRHKDEVKGPKRYKVTIADK